MFIVFLRNLMHASRQQFTVGAVRTPSPSPVYANPQFITTTYSTASLHLFVLHVSLLKYTLPENCALLGHHAASSGNFLPMFRENLSGPIFRAQRALLTSYRSHPQESRGPWALKMRPIGCPETSVWNYHYSLRNNPAERHQTLSCL